MFTDACSIYSFLPYNSDSHLQLLLESSAYVNTGDIMFPITKSFCMFENLICSSSKGKR